MRIKEQSPSRLHVVSCDWFTRLGFCVAAALIWLALFEYPLDTSQPLSARANGHIRIMGTFSFLLLLTSTIIPISIAKFDRDANKGQVDVWYLWRSRTDIFRLSDIDKLSIESKIITKIGSTGVKHRYSVSLLKIHHSQGEVHFPNDYEFFVDEALELQLIKNWITTARW